VLFTLLACTEPLDTSWSSPTEPTVERDTQTDTAGSDTAGPDTGADDTGVQDSGADDTGAAPDTGTADTATDSAADTGAEDSGATDTSDTGTEDSGGDTGTSVAADAPVDWTLEDLNPGSPRFGEPISPRDYISRVSGYYFIHST
jgi:hypothetical protein